MTYISTLNNALTSLFVKFANRENLKKFCRDNGIGFNESAFTRNRIFSLRVILGYILQPRGHNLFIDGMSFMDGIGANVASAAAFARRRGLIPEEYLEEFHRELLSRIYTDGMAPGRWNGHLLLGCDGTTLSIQSTGSLRDYFLRGRKTGKSDQPLARSVVLKDVVNDIVLGANMECYGDDEIKLAVRLFEGLPEVIRNLLPVAIFDRKFCAYTLVERLTEMHIGFIIRVKSRFNADVDRFVRSGMKETVCILRPGATTLKKLRHMYGNASEEYRVRLIRCPGDVVVMTSVIDDRSVVDDVADTGHDDGAPLPTEDVYRLRWTDETTIGFLKNNLEIEIFSSTRIPVMYQDFYSRIVNYNIVTLLARGAATVRRPRKRQTLHRLGINRNDTLGIVTLRFWKSLVLNNLKDSLPDMLIQIGRNTCPVIPDRHSVRVFRRIKSSGKYITLPNYRQVI